MVVKIVTCIGNPLDHGFDRHRETAFISRLKSALISVESHSETVVGATPLYATHT